MSLYTEDVLDTNPIGIPVGKVKFVKMSLWIRGRTCGGGEISAIDM